MILGVVGGVPGAGDGMAISTERVGGHVRPLLGARLIDRPVAAAAHLLLVAALEQHLNQAPVAGVAAHLSGGGHRIPRPRHDHRVPSSKETPPVADLTPAVLLQIPLGNSLSFRSPSRSTPRSRRSPHAPVSLHRPPTVRYIDSISRRVTFIPKITPCKDRTSNIHFLCVVSVRLWSSPGITNRTSCSYFQSTVLCPTS